MAQGEKVIPEPRLLFRLDFEDGFRAKARGGSEAPANNNLPDLVEGISGKAALFKAGNVLRYLSRDIINKERGCIAMWVQSPVTNNGIKEGAVTPDGVGDGFHTLLVEETNNVPGSNATWLWLHAGGGGLRFDVRDPRDQYTYIPDSAAWRKGEWHHIAATWEHKVGTKVYIDGELMGEKEIIDWPLKHYEAFFIGAAYPDGNQSWGGAIDEVEIYDSALTPDEIRKVFLRHGKLSMKLTLLDPYAIAGKPGEFRVLLRNPDKKTVEATGLRYEIKDTAGKVVLNGDFPDQSLTAGKSVLLKRPITLQTAGTYRVSIRYAGASPADVAEGFYTAIQDWKQTSPHHSPAPSRLVAQVQAAKTEPLAQSAPTKVCDLSPGSYREAGAARTDRFALNFDITDVGAPHVVVVTYPDDKPRTMEVILQDLSGKLDYQAQTGVFTGDEYPLSCKILEHRFIIWPRSTKQSLIFMTAEDGHPAAVQDIKVYRLDHVAAAPRKGVFSGSVPARNIGLYNEDPVLHQEFGEKPGFSGFEVSTDRLLSYMQSFGQNVLNYPIAWYNGPLYGTQVESRQPDMGSGIGGARPHPPGYPMYLLKRLEAQGMKFNAGVHIHWLPSLNPFTINDLTRVQNGEETVVNMRADGKLWWGHWHDSDPNYNPADPHVMASVKAVLDEIGNRYGQEPAFEGVTLMIARNKLFSFGSIESGYNDSNLVAFQEEKKITIPSYDRSKSTRFQDSYQWLKENPAAMKAWINWRCEKLHTHYQSMANELSAKRADLKLSLCISVTLPWYNQPTDYFTKPTVEFLREAGIDPALYAGDRNIIMTYMLVPADLRFRRAVGGEKSSPFLQDNRTAMTAPEVSESYASLPQSGAIFHDRYWEDSIGNEKPLKGLAASPQVKECPWRVSTLNANSFHAMEPYVAALNNTDAIEIVKGGYLIGTFGMEKEIAAFSAAYRALPAIKFDDVAAIQDPIRVRNKVVDGKLYFYALNRLPQPVTLKLHFNVKTTVEEPASASVTTQAMRGITELTIQLPPYALRTFRTDSKDTAITEGEAIVPVEWIASLKQSFDAAKLKADPSSPYLAFAEKCWKEKHYARLYFLLQESWAMKAAQ